METQKMIDELYYCAAQCTRCYDACKMEKDKEKLEKCIMFDEDCADICRLTGQLFERNSENTDIFLRLCAEMCVKCAEECEKHSDMEHCKKCAEVCRKCAEMCTHATV
jgi:hypothetical protein